MNDPPLPTVELEVNGEVVEVHATGNLLDALRDQIGIRSVKDGCSPQGQCGCCTVLVDDAPRLACVTPVGRVAGRRITTVDGLSEAPDWAEVFRDTGASQCGFCTPGIMVRLASLDVPTRADQHAVRRALQSHLCRCTGWEPIVSAAARLAAGGEEMTSDSGAVDATERATERAEVEGRTAQRVDSQVALGRGGFADDLAPVDALVAVSRADAPMEPGALFDPSSWVVAESLAAARAASGKIPGRRSTVAIRWPLELPPGPWARALRTTWVEPAYLEPDASWCLPDGEPVSPIGNGGAFGGKVTSPVPDVARMLANHHGRAVRVLFSREDVVRFGPKRPPMAIGMRADGRGIARVVRTPGLIERLSVLAPQIEVEEVDVPGPPTSVHLRAVGWAELAVLGASLREEDADHVRSPDGGEAWARIGPDGSVQVTVRCGADPTDAMELAVIRSYVTGATHMALGWVRSEALALDDSGLPVSLTIRSFGILRPADMPSVQVEVLSDPAAEPTRDRGVAEPSPMVNVSDAAFAAVAAAAWRAAGYPTDWPVMASRS